MTRFKISCISGGINHQYYYNSWFRLFRFLFRNRKFYSKITVYYPSPD